MAYLVFNLVFILCNLYQANLINQAIFTNGCNELCVTSPTAPSTCPDDAASLRYRSIDGICNNIENPLYGAINTPLIRLAPCNYYDNVSQPFNMPNSYKVLPTAQEITKYLFSMNNMDNGNETLSGLNPYFGQFLDHDITLSEHPPPINAQPTCNSTDDFQCSDFPILNSTTMNDGCHEFARSKPMCTPTDVREQANSITAFIDCSMIYGSKVEDTNMLRAADGKLKMSVDGMFLPENEDPLDLCNHEGRGGCFLAGDIRVNEHIALTSFHTLFAREHNRIAEVLKIKNAHWGNDKIFNETKLIITSIFQNIVYKEYLPSLNVNCKNFVEYNEAVNPSIATEFSTAAFRFGHSQIKSHFPLVDKDYMIKDRVPLRQAFFNTTIVRDLDYGVNSVLLGLINESSEKIDDEFAEDIAQHLFVPETDHTGFKNLAALNIQRGRDHGLPSYAKYWSHVTNTSMNRITNRMMRSSTFDEGVCDKLDTMYKLSEVDLFVGGILEKKTGKGVLGKTFRKIIKDQFVKLRDGDRFYYENVLKHEQEKLDSIKNVKLARIICNNLEDENILIPKYVLKRSNNQKKKCERLPKLDLDLWDEPPPPPPS